MKKEKKELIPEAVISRLPMYCQELQAMQNEFITVTSSERLAQRMEATPEQIRKDLNYFGALGHKGVGYIVSELLEQLKGILGLNRKWRVAIAGLGNIGKALINYDNLSDAGFEVVAAFDRNPDLITKKFGHIEVENIGQIKECLLAHPVDIVAVTVRGESAQAVVDEIVSAGIKGIWLFSPVRIEAPNDVTVVRADLLQSISILSYHLNNL